LSESPNAPRFDARDAAGLFVRGLAMGAADVVPGVSGGTIAFITGIYARFIGALRSLSVGFLGPLARGRVGAAVVKIRAMHWSVLIPVGLGVAVSVVALSKLITGLMVDQPAPTFAFFFGLILASAYIPLARVSKRAATGALALALGAVGAWLFVGLQTDGIEVQVARSDAGAKTVVYAGKLRSPADLETITAARDVHAQGSGVVVFDAKGVLAKAGITPAADVRVITHKAAMKTWLETKPALVVLEEKRASLPFIFLCGLLAISAMVLPGVSGSFLLLFLGQYHAVFTGIHQCIGHGLGLLGKEPDAMTALTAHAWTTDFIFVGVFGLGILVGLAAFSRVVSWLFERFEDVTLFTLTGLMLGALRLPGEVVYNETGAGGAGWGGVIGAALVGVIIVVGLAVVDRRARAGAAAA
jgi:uncharacterized membrane protein